MRWALLALLFVGCNTQEAAPPPTDPGPDPKFPFQPPKQKTPDPTLACAELGLPSVPMSTSGPFGILRHDLADDFSLPLIDGSTFTLSERWSGCESYVFIPSARINSGLDDTSIWERDVDQLVAISPGNVHYFFVANRDPATASDELAAMQGRIDTALSTLDEEAANWWRDRLHVVASHADGIDGWVGELFAGLGRPGFAIDRRQQIRLLGSFADVKRYSMVLDQMGEWPFEANMAYASYEARHYNFEAERDALLGEGEVTIVSPWSGEVLAETVETTVTLPDAATMAAFDTFTIDLTMDCPDPDAGEFGNCGAWDYISRIAILDDDGVTWREIARFITTYHREGRYVVDATPMLVFLRSGGERQIRFEVSPPWNPQAYLTQMDFRFSNENVGHKPTEATFLYGGGTFDSTYNDDRLPIDVAIPAGAKKVELWAIVTGHGGDAFNCAEFCNHQHAFTVGATTHTKTHPMAATNEGCIEQVDFGMVPNQGGTWWLGRGGWCPGQQVEPWVVDVTADAPAGQTVTVSYEGLFNGNTPPDNAGNIELTSYLVVYE